MSIRRLKCFIAMPFDRTDTDYIYKLVYKKLLGNFKITEVRVDVKEHNKNINDFIIEEIKKSDFMITDLTYARPSVYYESGFGERKIPVIYTVRKDHFKGNTDDLNSNLSVHFDVSMRNIICWEKDKINLFKNKLESRVKHVTRPIIRQLKIENKNKQEETDFNNKSELDKIKFLTRPLILRIGKKKAHKLCKSSNEYMFSLYSYASYGLITNHVLKVLHFHLCKNIDEGDLRSTSIRTSEFRNSLFKDKYFKYRIKRIHTVEENHIICSINNYNVGKMKNNIHSSTYGSDKSELILENYHVPFSYILNISDNMNDKNIIFSTKYHFVCGIKSKSDATNRFQSFLDKIYN